MSKIELNDIDTSQAVINSFYRKAGTAVNTILAKNSIFINENPDQLTKNDVFTVTIGSISTTKALIDSDYVENLYYIFKRDSKNITNTFCTNIGIDENQGTVEIEPSSSLSTLSIDGVPGEEEFTTDNTGTATLKAKTVNIEQGNIIQLNLYSQPNCDVVYFWGRNSTIATPDNNIRPFRYTAAGWTYSTMYKPGDVYYLGYSNNTFYYFTLTADGVQYLELTGSQVVNTSGKLSKHINFTWKESPEYEPDYGE